MTTVTGAGPRITAEGDGAAVTVSVTTGSGGGGDVASVNGQTGVVVLDAADVGAASLPVAQSDVTGLAAALAGKEAAGTAASAVTAHNTSGTAHREIRPVVCNLALGVAATDGTATVFDILVPSRGATASGNVPAEWSSAATIPSVAALEGALAGSGITTLVALVPDKGVFTVAADAIDTPWTNITPDPGVLVIGPANTTYWPGRVDIDGTTIVMLTAAAPLTATDIAYTGTGLLGASNPQAGINVGTNLNAVEGTLDRWHFVSAFSTTNIDTSLYTAPVASVDPQPTLDGGVAPVPGSSVWLFAQTDPGENGAYNVDDSTGVWTKYEHPDVFDPPGNGYRVTVLADGEAVDGVTFMWLDDDPSKFHRVSGSDVGDGPAEPSATGRWVRFETPSADLSTAPGGATVDVVSNVATARILGRVTSGSGDSEELTAAQVRTLLAVDSEMHVISDEVLASSGTFADVDITDYTDLEVRVTGYGTAASSTVGVRGRFLNGGGLDNGNNYSIGTAAVTSAWNNNGTIAGSLTNSNRRGRWSCDIFLGGSGNTSHAVYRSVAAASDASVGLAEASGSLHYWNTTAPTGLRIYASTGDFAAGSRLTVRGRKLPA